jgi:hypothetical protein
VSLSSRDPGRRCSSSPKAHAPVRPRRPPSSPPRPRAPVDKTRPPAIDLNPPRHSGGRASRKTTGGFALPLHPRFANVLEGPSEGGLRPTRRPVPLQIVGSRLSKNRGLMEPSRILGSHALKGKAAPPRDQREGPIHADPPLPRSFDPDWARPHRTAPHITPLHPHRVAIDRDPSVGKALSPVNTSKPRTIKSLRDVAPARREAPPE